MRFLLCVAGGFALAGLYHSQASATPAQDCKKPVYLTFDTGHMAVAPVIADILARQKVVVTFFAANEKTKEGDGSLGEHWGGWWRERAKEGHEFAPHTFNHVYWVADAGKDAFG